MSTFFLVKFTFMFPIYFFKRSNRKCPELHSYHWFSVIEELRAKALELTPVMVRLELDYVKAHIEPEH